MLLKSSKAAMIERIKGTIVKKHSNFVVLDVNGIGLKINMSINSLRINTCNWQGDTSLHLS